MNYLEIFKSENELYSYISKRMKEIRRMNGLTQSKISEILDISEQNYVRVERGYNKTSIYFLFKFCSVFDLSLNEFFKIAESDEDNCLIEMKELIFRNKTEILELSNIIKKYYEN